MTRLSPSLSVSLSRTNPSAAVSFKVSFSLTELVSASATGELLTSITFIVILDVVVRIPSVAVISRMWRSLV